MKIRILEVCVFCFVLALGANAQPVITSEPQSSTNNIASAADFSVVASNAMTYQWYFQGTSLAGETNATLSLDDLITNQAGSYTVVVSNANGSVTSMPPAVLTIVPGTLLQWTISTFPNGGSSNFLVQLFDHDKPATVANFIHYITSGLYSNMFFERDMTNFVLQGGDYATTNQYSTNQIYAPGIVPGTNFPPQVDSEFGVGPLIHNTFGTLAMALVPGESNSATSGFFFNLTNNSQNLDTNTGGFTVFGRILFGTNSGSNILQYFNTLSPPSNGIFTNLSLAPTIPVNDVSTNYPADSNLFYCDFAFISPTNPPVITNPPTISITYPPANTNFPMTGDLTAMGTASDSQGAGLARVYVVLRTLAGARYGAVQSNDAVGTYSWSLDLGTNLPGVYELTAYAQDGFGNLSAATNYFTNQANLPAGLSITSPAEGSTVQTTNASVTISGTIPPSISVTQLTVQLFYQFSSETAALTPATNGTTWSLVMSNLLGGPYTIVVEAIDSLGQEGFVMGDFTAIVPPVITTPPANVSALLGSSAEFTVTVFPAFSYQWLSAGTNIPGATNATLVVPDVTSNLTGSSYEVIVTARDGQMVTSAPPAVLTVVTGTLVQITFSGYPGGGSSNVMVQLYDFEKPATVANFLHYLTPVSEYVDGISFGSYLPLNNMIWDRCIPGFILQGGDYDATDRTNGNPIKQIDSINIDFTQNQTYLPLFAGQVDNEFSTGPVIHNTFGTLAMTKNPGYPDSAANGFFFNLADNSSNLDNQNGGYTVFGSLLPGSNYLQSSNVLQYFNTLSKPYKGIFDGTTVSTNQSLANLPVNYDGMEAPLNSNLFFGDFTLLSTFSADTNPPTVAVTSLTNGQTMTNADVVVQGTASDNVAVANVACFFHGTNYTNAVYAIGTTNWTADLGILPPGEITNVVVAQDGAGNASRATNTFVVPFFPFTISTTGRGTLSANLTSSNTSIGTTYTVTATAGKGSAFANWTVGTNVFIEPSLTFVMANALQITAHFVSNDASGGISITYPSAGAGLTNSTLSIKGKVSGSLSPTQITCQVFSAETGLAVTSNMVVNAADNLWSTPPLSLAPGDYYAQAIAQAADGRAALYDQGFVILTPLTVIVYGRGGAAIANRTYLRVGQQYTQGAEPAAGESFLSWNSGSGAFVTPVFPFIMYQGLTFTLTLISNSAPGKLTMTSPAAHAQVTNPVVTFAGKIVSPLAATQVVCQLFESNAPVTGFMPAAITNNSWTLTVSNLTMGLYNAVAIATDSSGHTKLVSELVTVNFYPNLAGSYKGLFLNPADVSPANAGYLSFRLTANSPNGTEDFAAVSGNLTLPLKNYSFSAQMTGTGSASVMPSGFDGNLALTFDLTNFSAQVTGLVSLGDQVVPLTAYRTLTKLSTNTVPSPGHYVLSLRPETSSNAILDGPPGDGFAAVTVSASGNVAVAGTMADNAPFSQSTGVFTNGVWPLYASFYKGRGILIGWETNLPSGECTGAIFWIKGTNNGVYYGNGVDEQISTVGANYVRPAPGVPYWIVFGGGTFNPPMTNEFSFSASGAMETTNQLKGSLVSSTGVLKGSVVNPTTSRTLSFSGVFISQSQGGGGFTLDADAQTGYFDITTNGSVPAPARQ